MKENVKGNNSATGGLWGAFHNNLLRHGIEPDHVVWYVRWAQEFAKSKKGSLVSRSGADILRYLEKLARRPQTREWQIKQAVHALRFLYQEQLNSPWAAKWEWDKAEQHALSSTGKSRAVRPDSCGGERTICSGADRFFADTIPGREFKVKHSEFIASLRKEIRRQRYPHRPGTAGARECLNHYDLYPCHESPRNRGEKSGRLLDCRWCSLVRSDSLFASFMRNKIYQL